MKSFFSTFSKFMYFPKFSGWVFLLLFVLMSITYGYQNILFKTPQSVHQWRQCDCLSLATNYEQDNNPFLQPSIHNLCSDGTGKTVSDFPLIYFTVGQLWKIFGHHEFIYRSIILLLFFLGLFALFRMTESLLSDSLIGMLVPLYLFTSPTLVYYANNFLMDLPAFSLGLIGLYWFIRFANSGKFKHLWLFALFYSVAGLLKIPALMGFFAISGIFVLELLGLRFKTERKIFEKPTIQILPFLMVCLAQIVWYTYAHWYNSENNYGIFLIGILPIWELSNAQIVDHLDAIREHIKWDYFRSETQLVLVLIFAFVLAKWRKADRLFLWLSLILSVGFVAFFILFFQPLQQHDYYTINLFVLAPIIAISASLLLKNSFNSVFKSPIFRLLLVAFLIHNADFARRRINGRYSLTGGPNHEYVEHLRAFTEIGPYLNEIGVKKEDRVISLSDPSINVSLYLMNQKGWSNFNVKIDSVQIENKKLLGAKYLFVYDDETLANPELRPFLQNQIGTFKTIRIYKL